MRATILPDLRYKQTWQNHEHYSSPKKPHSRSHWISPRFSCITEAATHLGLPSGDARSCDDRECPQKQVFYQRWPNSILRSWPKQSVRSQCPSQSTVQNRHGTDSNQTQHRQARQLLRSATPCTICLVVHARPTTSTW